MPQEKVYIRYIGVGPVEGLVPGYRYQVTREQEAELLADHGESIIRLEPDLEHLPLLTVKKPATRKKKE